MLYLRKGFRGSVLGADCDFVACPEKQPCKRVFLHAYLFYLQAFSTKTIPSLSLEHFTLILRIAFLTPPEVRAFERMGEILTLSLAAFMCLETKVRSIMGWMLCLFRRGFFKTPSKGTV